MGILSALVPTGKHVHLTPHSWVHYLPLISTTNIFNICIYFFSHLSTLVLFYNYIDIDTCTVKHEIFADFRFSSFRYM